MDNVLILDTSGSMSGIRLDQLKDAVGIFLDNMKGIEVGRVALVEFGQNTRVLASLTNDYNLLHRIVDRMQAGGSTPMSQGLALGLKEIIDNGRFLPLREGITIVPRIILMTDGEPDNKAEVQLIAKKLGEANIPIACVGVSECDQRLMSQLGTLSGGMFVMVQDIEQLQSFFMQQTLLLFYIVEMIDELEKLRDREVLREYMQQKTGREVSDEEVDAFMVLLQHLVVADAGRSGGSSRSGGPSSSTMHRTAGAEEFSCGTCLCLSIICPLCIPCWCLRWLASP